MTKRIGNKNEAQHRGKKERLEIKRTNIALEAVKKAAAKAKYHKEVKGRISAAQAAQAFTAA